MKLYIYPYKGGSQSARELALGLGVKRIKNKGSKFKGTANKTVINWGSSAPTANFGNAIIINHPQAVRTAANKLGTMTVLSEKGVSTPDWTHDKAVATGWFEEVKGMAYCRTKLTGHSGEGIVVAETVDQLVDAPLYTKRIVIGHEYRVHVFRGQVLDIQRKARKKDVADEDVNWRVRNLEGGFIFARGDVEAPPHVYYNAVSAIEALGLDFGAVDIVTRKRDDTQSFVLEVNTACGLMGTTLEKYIEAFKEL